MVKGHSHLHGLIQLVISIHMEELTREVYTLDLKYYSHSRSKTPKSFSYYQTHIDIVEQYFTTRHESLNYQHKIVMNRKKVQEITETVP